MKNPAYYGDALDPNVYVTRPYADAARSIMVENLRLYERREPCRTPWRDGEMP
jgi:hypothetical protein